MSTFVFVMARCPSIN